MVDEHELLNVSIWNLFPTHSLLGSLDRTLQPRPMLGIVQYVSDAKEHLLIRRASGALPTTLTHLLHIDQDDSLQR